MPVSENLQKRILHAVTDQTLGRELIEAIQVGEAAGRGAGQLIAAAIVATATSQTTDFGALLVGDQVIMIPATAGNADLITIATAGNLGQAAVIGNIYLVLRPIVFPAAPTVKL